MSGSTAESGRPWLRAQHPSRLPSQVPGSPNSSFLMPDSQTQLVLHSCSNVELRWLHGAALPAAVPVAMDGERSPSPGHAAPRQRGMQNTGPSAPLQPSLFFYKHNVWGGSNTALFPLRVLQLAPGSMQICALLGISAIIIAHGHLSTHTHTHTKDGGIWFYHHTCTCPYGNSLQKRHCQG